MKQVIKVRMVPSETQAEALAATLTTCNKRGVVAIEGTAH